MLSVVEFLDIGNYTHRPDTLLEQMVIGALVQATRKSDVVEMLAKALDLRLR